MAATKISDIIVPAVWAPYVVERTAALSALWTSGIVSSDADIQTKVNGGGKLIDMPFWKDLTGNDEVLSDSASLTVGNIGTGKDIAVKHFRGKAWGVNDLARALSGDDPAGAIAELAAMYWSRRMQALLISTLKGIFADNVSNDSGDMSKDVSIADGNNAGDANKIGPDAIIDAIGTMGDAWERLAAMCMHSVPFRRLQKLDLITYQKLSDQDIQIPYYLGKRVIVDDTCPVVAGGTSGYVYTTYLFGTGAVAGADATIDEAVETDRDKLAGEDYLIHRRHFILHVRGVKFTSSSVAGNSPTNAEAETTANWDRVYERKNVRIAQLKTNG